MGVNRYICQTVGGRNNGEPVTGSRPAQVHWCMHAVKAGLCGPIKQASYYSSNAPKLMLVLIERCQNTKYLQHFVCWICVCIAAEQSECPRWLLSTTISCWWEVQCGQPRSLLSLFGSLCCQLWEPSHHCLIRLMCITIRLLEDFTDRRNVYTVI